MITAGLILTLFILPFSDKAFANYATLLIYHKFDEYRTPSTSIPVEDFERQMRYLKENNYNVISLDKLLWHIENKKPFPEKTVVITIDDGYKSTMKAFQVLKKYNFPFTVFLYMEGVGRYPDYLTKEQLDQLKKYPKVTFGNHSYAHLRFGRLLKKMSKKEFKKFVIEDTEKAEKRFKKLIGYKPVYYAFPYGEYNKIYIEILKKRGYKALFTQDPANVSENISPYLIHRQPIVGNWGDLKHFIRALNTEALDVEYHYPDIGFIDQNPLPYIKAKLKHPEKYKNCEIYVSELGWSWAKEKDGFLVWEDLPELKRDKNRIGVKCTNKETGKKAAYFWLILN